MATKGVYRVHFIRQPHAAPEDYACGPCWPGALLHRIDCDTGYYVRRAFPYTFHHKPHAPRHILGALATNEYRHLPCS